MNKSLFTSRAAFVFGGTLVVFVAGVVARWWPVAGGVGFQRTVRIGTGIAALVCLLAALAYVLRKYMHRLHYSPEFKRKVSIQKLERADHRLNELRRAILQGSLADKREIETSAARILSEEGVERIYRVRVEAASGSGPRFTLDVSKVEPFKRVADWMHLHLYISLCFALCVVAHAGSIGTAPMGLVLWIASLVVLVTGSLGIYLWATGPMRLTRRERDLSIEEAYVLSISLRAKLDAARNALDPALAAVVRDVESAGTDARARAASAVAAARTATVEARTQLQDVLVLVGQERLVRDEFKALWRIRLGFMSWRAIHIPAALVLSSAVILHLISIWIY